MGLKLAWSCAVWVWGREWVERSAPFKLRAWVLASPLRGLPGGDANQTDRPGGGYPLRRALERAGGAGGAGRLVRQSSAADQRRRGRRDCRRGATDRSERSAPAALRIRV